MVRRGRQREGGSPAPPTVVSGVLGDPGDDDRIDVTFRIEGDRVRLTAGEVELGAWALEDVAMTAGGTALWYFEAEGDRLAFVPSRPAALEASALVAAAEPARARRPRRRRDPAPTRPEAASAPLEEGASTRPEPAKEPTKSPSRTPRIAIRIPKPTLPRPTRARRGREAPATEPQPARGQVGLRRRYWLRSIDFARRQGLFGLDRLPVDEANRSGEHQHTWEHPAAATSGPAQWVCTICGRIRR